MQNFSFHIPTKIIFGTGNISMLPLEIPDSTTSILIVTDQNLHRNTGIINHIRMLLSNYNVFVFDQIEENPSIESVDIGADFAKKHFIDLILGIGGGSSMDAAKGIALTVTNDVRFESFLNGEVPINQPLPFICIPTTSGTGSEVTPFAVFTDKVDESKKGYSHPSIFPLISVIDPELTYSMPESVRINTGLDVLAHASEAYLSLDSNMLNDQIALESVRLVISNLPLAVKGNLSAINLMAYASVLAGIAITHASTILPHIMGYPLTVFHQIPHGKASILTLPAFLDFLEKIEESEQKVRNLKSIFNLGGGLSEFLKTLGISPKLSDYGVNEEEIDLFIEKTIHKGDIKITPGNIDRNIVRNLYYDSL
ncbi:MAG: iron-containing alcohol dehydrogenase [Bacteroidetes bacterium]|nr:iron-containing alcohol dehydrogenase [Bacteroidota bacterium]